MQIYVVQNGDNLWKISNTFSVPVSRIVYANEIPEPNNLVVGQALVIPIYGSYYFVQPGDSLWKIGRKFKMNFLNIAKINKINPNAQLQIGTRIYIPPQPKTKIETNAYIEPRIKASDYLLTDLKRAAPFLTYTAPFSYRAKSDGTLSELNLSGIEQIARMYNSKLMMVVSNIDNNGFSADVARDILESPEIQNTLIKNIINKVNEVGFFSDVHFDFEYLPVDLTDEYTAFLKKATALLHKENLIVSAALAPKTSKDQKGQWYEGHDYKAIGNAVDFVVIMTYEWGYSGGPPLPVSPIIPVEKVLKYALNEIPAKKIMMGQNLYGYDWKLPYVQGEQVAKAISSQFAIELAKKYNQSIKYDYTAQAPYFNYYDENKIKHIVWFEDARSIQAKFDLLKSLNLRGISYWKLGLPFPQNWLLIGSNFDVIKK